MDLVEQNSHSDNVTGNTEKDQLMINSVESKVVDENTNCTVSPLKDISDDLKSSEEDDSEAESDEVEFAINASIPAEVLMAEGDQLKSSGDIESAISKYFWALTNVSSKFGLTEESGIDPRLANYYLKYADALLEKEELSSNLFQFDRAEAVNRLKEEIEGDLNGKGSSSSIDRNPDASVDEKTNSNRDVSDEEIAWENFEAAKLAFIKRIVLQKEGTWVEFCNSNISVIDQPQDSPDVTESDSEIMKLINLFTNCSKEDILKVEIKDVELLVYTFMRLGDMLQLAEKYKEASSEYLFSIKVIKLFGLSYVKEESPLVCLAQCQLFAGELNEAKKLFTEALDLVNKHISGYGGVAIPESKEQKEAYRLTVEELEINIADIDDRLKKNPLDNRQITAKPSETLLQDASTFSKSIFDQSEPIKVVNASIEVPDNNEMSDHDSKTQKKRRIDLSKI